MDRWRRHAGITMARVAAAFALALVPGVAVGLAMGISRRVRDGLDPLFAVTYPIPSVLFLPLFSFVLGPAEAALVATSAMTSFFLVAYTTMTGVQQMDRTVLEAATHFGARGRTLFAKVLLPGAMPFIFTGMRLGLGYALIVVIAVEMASAQQGLGALLWLSWGLLKVEDMYAALGAIALLGGGLLWTLGRCRRRLVPVAESDDKGPSASLALDAVPVAQQRAHDFVCEAQTWPALPTRVRSRAAFGRRLAAGPFSSL